MLAFESRSSRRFFLSLGSGERLAQVLVEFMRAEGIDRAQVHASGRARSVRLAAREAELRGALPFTLTGTVARDLAQSSELVVLVVVDGAPIAGALVDAEVERCELAIVTFDALHSTSEVRTAVPRSGAGSAKPSDGEWGPGESHSAGRGAAGPSERREPKPVQRAPEPARPKVEDEESVSWAELAHASRAPEPIRRPAPRPAPKPAPVAPVVRAAPSAPRAPPPPRGVPPVVVPSALPERKRTSEDEFFEEPSPEPGEYVEHSVFGLCRVEDEDTGAGLVIALPSGARKALNLNLFRVLEPRIEDDRIIYPVEPRKR